MNKLLLRPEEAAQLLGISRARLYQLIAAGQIGSLRIGRSRRIPFAALEKFVAERFREETRVEPK